MIGQMRDRDHRPEGLRARRGATRIDASTSRRRQPPVKTRHRQMRTWLTRRQTTCRRPNRSTRLRSGSRGRISHHRPVHLLPAAQGLARLPADERIQRLRADRWIGYPRAVEALNRLETLYAWPNKQRMPNLLLVGPTNNGKSMIVEKFRRTHPAAPTPTKHIPVLVVQMPSGTVGNPLLRRAARGDGCPIAPAPTAAGNGTTGAGPAAQGRRAHAGDRRVAQRPGR